MPDVFTKTKRSAVMSRIRGSGNRDTELRLIALFRANGITGWRRRAALFGKPDFVFRRERVIGMRENRLATGMLRCNLIPWHSITQITSNGGRSFVAENLS
jgi:DNA mismatch endonuclease (patch repair protein)